MTAELWRFVAGAAIGNLLALLIIVVINKRGDS